MRAYLHALMSITPVTINNKSRTEFLDSMLSHQHFRYAQALVYAKPVAIKQQQGNFAPERCK